MTAHVDRIGLDYVKKAIARPGQAQRIYRDGADTLLGFADAPENVTIAPALLGWAARLADAADRPAAVSDFLDQLQERVEAYRQVGSPYDDLGPVARQQEIHTERTPGLPRVSITPKSVNQWTRLGDQATIKWHPTEQDGRAQIKQSNTIAFWQGTKEESQAVTVDTAILDLPKDANPDGGPRPYAVITYGSDGAVASVKVDIGQRVTVVGSYVSVLVALNPPQADYPKGQVTVGASIGFFAAPSAAPVMCTEYLDNLGAAEVSVLVPRPSKATFLLPMQSNVLSGTATIEFLSLDGVLVQYATQWINSAQNVPIPLTADISFVRLTNTGTAANFRLPFQLSM
jgi:hypothetical protein